MDLHTNLKMSILETMLKSGALTTSKTPEGGSEQAPQRPNLMPIHIATPTSLPITAKPFQIAVGFQSLLLLALFLFALLYLPQYNARLRRETRSALIAIAQQIESPLNTIRGQHALPESAYPEVPLLTAGLYQGTASQYANWSTTEGTITWNIEHGFLPADTLGRYDSYVAIYWCSQVGLEMLIRPLGRDYWDTAIAVDCSDRQKYPWEAKLFAPPPEGEGWLLELDALTAQRWGVVGRGIIIEMLIQ